MRALVTGGSGILGREVVRVLGERGVDVLAPSHETLSVTDANGLRHAVKDFAPQVVYHLAAMTDVDRCEREPRECALVNLTASTRIANLCEEFGTTMVYASTGQVLGTRHAISVDESAAPVPANRYAASKFSAEQHIRTHLPTEQWLVARMCWLYGSDHRDPRLVGYCLGRLHQDAPLPVIRGEFGSPTSAADAAERIVALWERGLRGLHHVANVGCVERPDVARYILQAAGDATSRVRPVLADAFLTARAPRPVSEAMHTSRADVLGTLGPMRSWDIALGEYLRALDVAATGTRA